MPTDELRARFLRDRVLTASPAQRVVMLYDRLGLDLSRAQTAEPDSVEFRGNLSHSMQVLAELMSSLNVSVGGPAANLASIYAFLLRELVAIRGGATQKLGPVREMVSGLRESWATVADEVGVPTGPPAPGAAALGAAAGSWVG